jgi:kynurenine formamidase
MPVIDLTRHTFEDLKIETQHLPLQSDKTKYTGVIYQYHLGSMDFSYIDLPGHILETDDGQSCSKVDISDYYRVPSTVIRMDLLDKFGAVTKEMLEYACGGVPQTPGVIINALGDLDPRDVSLRSVWLTLDAVDWLIQSGCKLIVSDIYESNDIEGVFYKFFQAGIATVCEPVNLGKIPTRQIRLSVMFPPINATQVPCRIIGEY